MAEQLGGELPQTVLELMPEPGATADTAEHIFENLSAAVFQELCCCSYTQSLSIDSTCSSSSEPEKSLNLPLITTVES